jgi:tetratricopeptide (TPR) repeat protein
LRGPRGTATLARRGRRRTEAVAEFKVPAALQRLADQIDGWLDLRVPDRALDLLAPMLADPEGRPAGLVLRVRAYARLGRFADALPDLAELRTRVADDEWIELTEAWCRKRTGDLAGAVTCLERVVARNQRSDVAHFNLGCYLALAGERDRAIDEVTLACGINDECRDFARDDPDLDGLRTDPRFRVLLREEPAAAGADEQDDDEDDDLDDGEDDDLEQGADDDDGGGGPDRGGRDRHRHN